MNFTFALPVPKIADNVAPMQTTFSALPSAPPTNPRSNAQARYRARNRESEQIKARERMARRRLADREELQASLKRQRSSELLRET